MCSLGPLGKVEFFFDGFQEKFCWFKCCCSGIGCYCPQIKEAMIMPIHYGQNLCLESSCGLRPDGSIAECFPHPVQQLWCASRCCCLKDYCGIPWMNEHTETWFQLCCLKVTKTSPSCEKPAATKFCWYRCCCEGLGLEWEGFEKAIKPIEVATCCCVASECGCYDGQLLKVCPNPMQEPLCKEKCCCVQHYCGVAPCLAEPMQILCCKWEFGKGKAFEPLSGKDANPDVKSAYPC